MPNNVDLTLDTVVMRVPDVIFTHIDNDLVMLSIRNSKYYGSGEVGNRIWELIEQPTRIDDVCKALLGEFDIDRATCEHDVLTFLTQLRMEKLIDVKGVETSDTTP